MEDEKKVEIVEENTEISKNVSTEEYIDEEGNPIDVNSNDEFNNGKGAEEDE